jgi:peptide/nickel transport system substrate-binding protein
MSKAAKWTAGALAALVVAGGGAYAWSQSQGGSTTTDNTKVGNFNVTYNNPDKATDGGDLQVAYVSETPFVGQWVSALSNDATSSEVQSPAGGTIFNIDDSFKIIDGGPADIEFDEDAKTATITLRDDLKWSDGEDVTAKDLWFSYILIANPDYESSRWTDSLANIVGLEEYHNGEADDVEGLTFPDGEDGKVLTIQFKDNKPGFTQLGSGYILASVEPYHYLKDIEPSKLASAPETTTKPLVIGAYKPEKIVSGESIRYVPNEHYWGEEPKLDSITYSIVAPNKLVAALKSQQYDIVNGASNDLYDQVEKVKGYEILGQQDLYFSALYFNLGEYDTKTSKNVTNRETPLQDKNLRQALGYARNVDEVFEKFSNGLSTRANSTIPPVFSQFTDDSIEGYPLDLDKANELLDEAGYKWHDEEAKDYRLDKDGKKLELTYLARSGNANSETIAQNYIQQWKKIGVDVKLYKNRLTDFNTWVEIATSPKNDDWDLTDGAWSLSAEPSQQDLFSASAPYNFSHFTSDKLTELLNDIDSEKAQDPDYRKKAFVEYQKYVNEEAFIIPTGFNISYTPVNKRVVNATLDYGENEFWAKLAVSSDKRAAE